MEPLGNSFKFLLPYQALCSEVLSPESEIPKPLGRRPTLRLLGLFVIQTQLREYT